MTTPTGPIVGVASVAITPSTTAFNQQLQAGLQNARRAISDAADDMGDAISREITRGVAEARLALASLGQGLNERLRVTVEVSKDVTTGLLGIGATATKVGAGIGALGIAVGSTAAALGGLLAVASEVSGVLIALPAVVGSAALVMGTFKIAIQGVGDAIGAGLSGDTAKFAEALKELAPAAQTFARNLSALRPQIEALKDAVQQNFFAQFTSSFDAFSKQAVQVGGQAMPRIATELGKIGDEFFKTASTSSTFFDGVRALVDQTVGGLQRWRGVTGELATALGNLFKVGSELAGDMIGGVGQLVGRFSEWVNVASQTGELQARLQNALDTIAQLGRVIGNVGDIFGAVWAAAGSAGVGFLDVLERITDQFATFLNSDFGQTALESLMTTAGEAMSILGEIIAGLLPALGHLMIVLGEGLTGALRAIQPALGPLIEGLKLFAGTAGAGVATALQTLGGSIATLMTALAPLLPVIGEIVGILAQSFVGVLDVVIRILADFFTALQPFMPAIKTLIENGLAAFVDALRTLAGAITPLLPVLIQLGLNVLQTLADVFIVLMNAVKPFLPVLTQLATQVLTMVAEHFMHLFQAIQPLAPVIIELISKGLEVLAGILPTVVSTFKPLLPIVVDVAKAVAKSLAPVLPAVADAFKEIFKQLGPVLPQLAELGGQLLVTAAQLFTKLVQAVVPLLPPLLEIGTEILKTMIPAINDLLQAIIPLLPVISDLALQLLRDALLPIVQALLPFIPMLVDAFTQLLPPLVDLLIPLTDIVIQLTPLIVLFTQLTNVILQVVMPAVVLFITVVNELRAIALTLLGAAIDALKVTVEIAFKAIVAAIEIAWIIIKGIFDTIISVLQGDFGEAWNRLERLVKDVWNRLKEFILSAIGDIVGYLVEWGSKLWNAAKNAFQRIWDALDEVFGGLLGSFAGKLVDLVKWLGTFKGAIGLFFMDAGKWLYDVGKAVIQGFINGLTDAAEFLYDKLQGIIDKAKGLWDKATGWAFGSPSKWTTQRGEWVVEGFADGLEAKQSLAVDATRQLIDATKRPFETSLLAPTPNIAGTLGATALAAPGVTAGGSTQLTSVTFGQGAVVVSFEGVVPSEADALMTGRTVGRGILDVLAERDARLAVRVL